MKPLQRNDSVGPHITLATLLLVATLSCFMLLPTTVFAGGPAGTTITYQGLLRENGVNVDGPIDLEFRLFDMEVAGTQVGLTVMVTETVVDGLFTSQLDFGTDPYASSQPLWLEVVADGETLSRQQVTSAPFSLATRGINVQANGNVGIGGDSPIDKLRVAGQNSRILIDAPAGSFFAGARYSLNSQEWFAGANTVFGVTRWDLFDNTSGEIRMSVLPNGNVGIGTRDPDELLTVDGNANVTGATNLFGNTTISGELDVVNEALLVTSDGRVHFGGGPSFNAQVTLLHEDTNASTAFLSVTDNPGGRAISGVTQSTSGTPVGVAGSASSLGDGVNGSTSSTSVNSGVFGQSLHNTGVNYGVSGQSASPIGFGVFSFDRLGAAGPKLFVIDHPLDPDNKFLNYYCAEGPEPLNMITGNAILDAQGRVTVDLPDHYESIGRDFRYQLTAVGAPAPNLHVAKKVANGQFEIAGGPAGLEVSWRIDATRNDAFVRTYGAPVEQEKPDALKGKYLRPELFGKTAELGIHYRPRPDDVDLAPAADVTGRDAE